MTAKTILVVVDPHGAADQPVLARAAWLADRAGANLELFACDYDSAVETGAVSKIWAVEPGPREQVLLRHRQKLDAFASSLRARGLTVTVDVAWDFPIDEAIVKKVAASEPWLVAKDTEHHNIVQRSLLSNTDWYLIRHCPAPLLLVKPRPLSDRPAVIAAVDPLHEHDKPAQLDDAILRFADELARVADGTLHVVHAFALPMGLDLPADVRELVVQQHRDAIADLLKRHRVPSANVHLREGAAHDCLRRAADEWHADFVVMGAVARSGLNKLFIGSTAERALDKLPCDVLILRPAKVKRTPA